jgi:hypothetical protein
MDGLAVNSPERKGGTMKTVNCPCGAVVQGETDDAIVANVEAHIAADHKDLVGKYSREQILSMAQTT